MLNQQTTEKLYAMRLRGMADAFSQQQEDPNTTQLSFEERFALLVDRQWNWRQNRALQRRLRECRLQGPACVEDIDFRAARGLDKQVVRSWVEGRFPYSGESWQAFQQRVLAALGRVVSLPVAGNTIVFTSATPIGVCAAQTLEIHDGRAMWLAGVLLNASYSSFRVGPSELRLFSFNAAPHLAEPELRIFR